MANRTATAFVCQQCGGVQPRWSGRCDACGAWNSLAEETVGSPALPRTPSRHKRAGLEIVPLAGDAAPVPRRPTGIAEFDRVIGGGLVDGSVLLIGGDPGIGKSTLLMQLAGAIGSAADVLYISGEEAVDQLRMRADRLGVGGSGVSLSVATNVADIAASLDRPQPPAFVVVDSIQTMFVPSLESAPGTVAQVRTSAQELIRIAKKRGAALVVVGHVTKDGMIAGPRVLEHMVDTVLYFEGERGHPFRILRSVKNRFGATDEIGVFEMTDKGLKEVVNPSAHFLAGRDADVPGACVFAGIEGSRPILVEIQSLIAPSSFATPRRAVVGWDAGRLAMIIAVLEARCGLSFAGSDVYLNVAGGLRISEPAADLAVAVALLSSLFVRSVPADIVVFGEIGLGGEVRTVSRREARLKEAKKLGFDHAILPVRREAAGGTALTGHREVARIIDLLDVIRALPKAMAAERRGSGEYPGHNGA